MTPRYEGLVALVTGAASGLGRATAIRLGAEGARVACLDLRPAGESDDYSRTVCYDALTRTVLDTLTARPFYLIEAAAESVARTLLSAFPLIDRVVVEVRKPAAAIDAVFEHVGVVIERTRG